MGGDDHKGAGGSHRVDAETRSLTQSPFLTIWIRPRDTIRRIVDTNPTRHVLLLAALSGAAESLDRAIGEGMGDRVSLPIVLVIVLALGPIGGIVTLYVGGWLLRRTGSWLGGVATVEEVRAALAWATIPTTLSRFLSSLVLIAVFRDEAFTTLTPSTDALLAARPLLELLVGVLLVGIVVVGVVLGVWSLVISLKCLGEVHRFSAWRALGAMAIAFAVILIPVLLVVFILNLLG